MILRLSIFTLNSSIKQDIKVTGFASSFFFLELHVFIGLDEIIWRVIVFFPPCFKQETEIDVFGQKDHKKCRSDLLVLIENGWKSISPLEEQSQTLKIDVIDHQIFAENVSKAWAYLFESKRGNTCHHSLYDPSFGSFSLSVFYGTLQSMTFVTGRCVRFTWR